MSFLPLFRDKKHKFKNGYWLWNEKVSKLKFHSHGTKPHDDDNNVLMSEKENRRRFKKEWKEPLASKVAAKSAADKKMKNEVGDGLKKPNDLGLKFVSDIDETEEEIFLKCFQRPSSFYDSDVITIQDVKNLTYFTLRSKISDDLVEFLNTKIYDKFLHAVIFYIDLFLLVLEFLLIRRDELRDEMKIRDTYSVQIEAFLSKQLSDRRLLIAREYSKILLKNNQDYDDDDSRNECARKRRTRCSKRRTNMKRSVEKDLMFFESVIDFTIQCTFIVLHRRCFNTISCEVNRLFRTEFFNIAKYSDDRCEYDWDFREQQILFGRNWFENSLRNYRRQHSPLMAEMLEKTSATRNEKILKIGEEKYFGSNKYLLNLELEFSTPECHLHLIGRRCGILGHPKYFYDTTLTLNEVAVRKMNYSDQYDPYGLIRRCFINLYTSNDFIDAKRKKNMSTRLIIHREAYGGMKDQLKLWKRKEFIMRKNLVDSFME